MWRIDNRTPYAAERSWIRDADGAEVWVVAVKATYDILPDGTTRIAAEQPPVNTGPVPHPGLKSLRYDTDLGPAKSNTDIILNGHAHSPQGNPVSELLVGFSVAGIVRSACVYGDRHWDDGFPSMPTKPAPFTSMPLVYERAFGGKLPEQKRELSNPVGRGIQPDEEGRIWLPNIEARDKQVSGKGDRPPVTCFGALPVQWPDRRQYAGTYDDAWFEHRRPLIPTDLQPAFWQIAPAQQQASGHLKGGEAILLANLTPPGFVPDSRLALTLPKLTLAFQTYFHDGTMERSRARIHTVILEPDYPRLSVVHHMTLPCHPKVNMLDRTLIIQKKRPLDRPVDLQEDPLHWPDELARPGDLA